MSSIGIDFDDFFNEEKKQPKVVLTLSNCSGDSMLNDSKIIVENKKVPGLDVEEIPVLDLRKIFKDELPRVVEEEKETDRIVPQEKEANLIEESNNSGWLKGRIFKALLKLQNSIGGLLLKHFSDYSDDRKDEYLADLLGELDISKKDEDIEGILKLLLGPPKEEEEQEEKIIEEEVQEEKLIEEAPISQEAPSKDVLKFAKNMESQLINKELDNLLETIPENEPVIQTVHWGINCDL
mmetsp:Transcript_1935/g.1738  ORF Transcript_1935/g.1738 Transcript_1935/m.1738 type:complete len:238 (+) Transcript_1935:315-1028(+)